MAGGFFSINAPKPAPPTTQPSAPTQPSTFDPSTLPPNYHLPGGPNLNPQGDFNLGGIAPAPSDPTVTTQPQPYQQGPGGTSAGQGDYKTEFMQAVQDLGIDPHQLRANPALMDKVSSYLTQKYPGQQWANGGQKAGDWFSVNGQGFDVLPAGDNNFQWLSDPAGSTAGSGGSLGNMGDPSGFQTGTFTGGGQYPLASVMGTGLAQPWTTPFKAPDNLTEQNDPGFQARMKMGTDALERSAASRGSILTGGLLKGLDRYAQDYASNEYGNVYGRALGEYNLARGIFNDNSNTLYNRLGGIANIGENAAAGTGSLYQDIGNAQGAATNAGGAAYANAATNLGNVAGQLYAYNKNPDPYGIGGTDPYAANKSGYNTNGVGGFGVNYTRPNG